jgi:hypothetical protein
MRKNVITSDPPRGHVRGTPEVTALVGELEHRSEISDAVGQPGPLELISSQVHGLDRY